MTCPWSVQGRRSSCACACGDYCLCTFERLRAVALSRLRPLRRTSSRAFEIYTNGSYSRIHCPATTTRLVGFLCLALFAPFKLFFTPSPPSLFPAGSLCFPFPLAELIVCSTEEILAKSRELENLAFKLAAQEGGHAFLVFQFYGCVCAFPRFVCRPRLHILRRGHREAKGHERVRRSDMSCSASRSIMNGKHVTYILLPTSIKAPA